MRRLAALLLLALLLMACDPTPTPTIPPTVTPTHTPTPYPTLPLPPGVPTPSDWPYDSITRSALSQAATQNTSAKKGIAGPGGSKPVDLAVQQSTIGAAWWYDWDRCYTGGGLAQYMPMIRATHDWTVTDFTRFPCGSYWLIGNEPDNKSQDNLTPMEAAICYGSLTHAILNYDSTAKIIIGGFTDPSQYTRTTYKAQFESAWMSLYNENVIDVITGWHVHAYVHRIGSETTAQALQRVTERQLRAWTQENPGLELWVTEFGSLDNGADLVYIMSAMTNWMEAEAGVTRYAWFYNGDDSKDDYGKLKNRWAFCSLWDWSSGLLLPELTALGANYMALPDAISIPTPTPRPTGPVVLDDWQVEVLRLLKTIEAAVRK